jgi:hypothetical protein
VPAAMLRSSALILAGHGIGSSPAEELPAAVAEVLAATAAGTLQVELEVRPLSEVTSAWETSGRLVLTP